MAGSIRNRRPRSWPRAPSRQPRSAAALRSPPAETTTRPRRRSRAPRSRRRRPRHSPRPAGARSPAPRSATRRAYYEVEVTRPTAARSTSSSTSVRGGRLEGRRRGRERGELTPGVRHPAGWTQRPAWTPAPTVAGRCPRTRPSALRAAGAPTRRRRTVPRGSDRRAARGAALLRARNARLRPLGGGDPARARDRPGRDRLPRRRRRRDRGRGLPAARLPRRRAPLAGDLGRPARRQHRRSGAQRGGRRRRVDLCLVACRPRRGAATQAAVQAPAGARREGPGARRLLLLRRRSCRRAEGGGEGARRAHGVERARAAAGRRRRAQADAQEPRRPSSRPR